MIYGHAGPGALLNPVLVGVLSLATVAFFWSRVFPGQVRYPADLRAKSPPTVLWGGWDDSA
jgi:hypothetical protein